MKIIIADEIFDKTICYQEWYNGETFGGQIVEINDQYSDCVREDFDGYVFNVNKYNARKTRLKNEDKILELLHNLEKTDYIANKLAESVSKYISSGDNTDVLLLREKYAVELVDRENWRKQIDTLQQELNLLDK